VNSQESPKPTPEQNLCPGFRGSTDVGDYIRIWFGSADGQSDIIITRPIGKTDLDKKNDWVVLTPSQVRDCVNRKENPIINQILANRTEWKLERAERENLILRVNGAICYPNGTNREEAKARAKATAYAANGNIEPTKEDVLGALPEVLKKAETAFTNAIRSETYEDGAVIAHPDNHVTTHGQNFEPQVAAKYLKGMNRNGVMQTMQARMLNPDPNQGGGVFQQNLETLVGLATSLSGLVTTLGGLIDSLDEARNSIMSVPAYIHGRGGGRGRNRNNSNKK
jgi:hypothetical protein